MLSIFTLAQNTHPNTTPNRPLHIPPIYHLISVARAPKDGFWVRFGSVVASILGPFRVIFLKYVDIAKYARRVHRGKISEGLASQNTALTQSSFLSFFAPVPDPFSGPLLGAFYFDLVSKEKILYPPLPCSGLPKDSKRAAAKPKGPKYHFLACSFCLLPLLEQTCAAWVPQSTHGCNFIDLSSIISSFCLQSLSPEVNNYSVFMDLGPFWFNLAELFPT